MVLAGLATFVLVSSVLRDRSATVDVWMMAADVPAGVVLEADDLAPVAVSADDPLLPSFLASAGGLPTGTVRHDLNVGEPLLVSALVATDEAAVGRTFAVPVASVVLDGLGLGRGDRLDVIGLDGAGEMHYVITDVEVVRLPTAGSSTAFAAGRSRDGWVTVIVDDRQALRLSEVLARGPIELVRSTGAMPISAGSNAPSTAEIDAGAGS